MTPYIKPYKNIHLKGTKNIEKIIGKIANKFGPQRFFNNIMPLAEATVIKKKTNKQMELHQIKEIVHGKRNME